MTAFYVENVAVPLNDPSSPELDPQLVVEAFPRDRAVLIVGGSGLRVGFTEAEVDASGEGFPLNTSVPLRLVLAAGLSLYVREDLTSPPGGGTAHIDVMVTPV